MHWPKAIHSFSVPRPHTMDNVSTLHCHWGFRSRITTAQGLMCTVQRHCPRPKMYVSRLLSASLRKGLGDAFFFFSFVLRFFCFAMPHPATEFLSQSRCRPTNHSHFAEDGPIEVSTLPYFQRYRYPRVSAVSSFLRFLLGSLRPLALDSWSTVPEGSSQQVHLLGCAASDVAR